MQKQTDKKIETIAVQVSQKVPTTLRKAKKNCFPFFFKIVLYFVRGVCVDRNKTNAYNLSKLVKKKMKTKVKRRRKAES